jgi:hypothetical protein
VKFFIENLISEIECAFKIVRMNAIAKRDQLHKYLFAHDVHNSEVGSVLFLKKLLKMNLIEPRR